MSTFDLSIFEQQIPFNIPEEYRREVYLSQVDSKQGKRITQLRDGSVVFLDGQDVKNYIPTRRDREDSQDEEEEHKNNDEFDFFGIYEQVVGYSNIYLTGFEKFDDAVQFSMKYRDAFRSLHPRENTNELNHTLLIKNDITKVLMKKINV